MKLYAAKAPSIAAELIRALTQAGEIEVSNAAEAELDVVAVLKEYLRLDRELTEKAKDVLERRKLPFEQFGKIKRALAEEKDFGLGEEAITWISTQVIEAFMQSDHVDEIFADDAALRRRMKEVLRKHLAVDDELDAEVRKRIKNLTEGTTAWELEYGRVMEQIKQKHGIKG